MPYKDPEQAREASRRWYKQNPERKLEQSRKWRLDNKDKPNEAAKQWRAANKERLIDNTKRWRLDNPEKVRQTLAKRRSNKLQATPNWADPTKILAIYRKAAEAGYDVDHIVPLVSSKVCGLHVESNLQILPSDENRRKGNRWWPDMFEGDFDV